MSKVRIALIQTGGTIDKDYPRKTGGYAFEIAQPAIERVLDKINPGFEYEVFQLLKKDSLEITHEDRVTLHSFIEKLDYDKVIITHGTDTMIETGRHLNDLSGKVIIVTGAKLPERFSNSDAPVNIGTAIGAASALNEGVYVCMHGLVIPVDQAKRDEVEGTFYQGPS